MPRKYVRRGRKRKRTGVKRRPRKRRYRKRAYRGPRVVNALRPMGTTPTQLVKFRFTTSAAIKISDAATTVRDGNVRYYTFRANSPWDPDFSYTVFSRSVSNWDDFRYKYKEYVCLGSKIRIRPYMYEDADTQTQNSGHPYPVMVALNVDNDTIPGHAVTDGAEGLLRQKNTTTRLINLAVYKDNNPNMVMTRKWSLKKNHGIKDYKDNDDLWSLTNANPASTDSYYYHVCAANMEPDTVANITGTVGAHSNVLYVPPIAFTVQIDYIVAFRRPNQDAEAGSAI